MKTIEVALNSYYNLMGWTKSSAALGGAKVATILWRLLVLTKWRTGEVLKGPYFQSTVWRNLDVNCKCAVLRRMMEAIERRSDNSVVLFSNTGEFESFCVKAKYVITAYIYAIREIAIDVHTAQVKAARVGYGHYLSLTKC